MMHKEKIIHALIDCQICNRVLTQYLNEPVVFETITKENGSKLDACLKCADEHYEKEKHK